MTSTVIPTWGGNLIGLGRKNAVFNEGIIQLFQNVLKWQWKHFFSFLLDIQIFCIFGSSKQILVCNSPDSTSYDLSSQ